MSNNQTKNSVTQKNFKSKSEQIRIEMLADDLLSTLEINALVPDHLIDKIIVKKESIQIKKSYAKFDFSKYLQIAVVFAAAVCLGILMGKNANLDLLHKKQSQKEQALIELKEKHHLSDLNTFGRL